MSIRVTMLDSQEIRVGSLLGQQPPGIYAGPLSLPMSAVLDIAFYALTNTDLIPDDPRLAFVKAVKKMRVVAGWNAQYKGRALSKRLAVPVSKKRAR